MIPWNRQYEHRPVNFGVRGKRRGQGVNSLSQVLGTPYLILDVNLLEEYLREGQVHF